jgi:hypothetical protein
MNLSSNVNFFLGLQVQIKINHWQTKKHSRHEAFGSYYDKINELIDMYVEAAIGKHGRFKLDDDSKDIPLFNIYELNMKSLIKTVVESFLLIKSELDESDSDLLNILDEMIAETNKLSYLLTQD